MLTTTRSAAGIVLLLAVAACTKHADAPPSRGPAITTAGAPGVIASSPAAASQIELAAGDSVIDVAPSPFGPDVGVLVHSADGHARVARWTAGTTASTSIGDLPAGFTARAIAAHPAKTLFFVSGSSSGGKSQILAVEAAKPARTIFETPRQIGRIVVGSRPFAGDSGQAYRIFFAATLPNGGASLRSITERGTIEYQVVGPASEAVAFADDMGPGGLKAPYGSPLSFHPLGQPMLWQDQRGCAHAFAYDHQWVNDKTLESIPCDGATSIAPNGAVYLHWRAGQPGVVVISDSLGTSTQAAQYTFRSAPVSTPDGRGVIGVVAGSGGKSAIAYVPIDVPLADVANAWQHPTNRCELPILLREAGSFRESADDQLYKLYDRFGYDEGPRAPVLATTDLFWENFGAAFTGVFILLERAQAMPAFWAMVDSANVDLARQAPDSRWAKAFAAISDSRRPNPTGEAQRIATASGAQSSVLGKAYDFSELMPRGHYTSSDSMKQYFHAMHYFTEMNRLFDPPDMDVLATLPPGVQAAAWRFIDIYRPFISPSRASIVWGGRATPPIASYAKHPRGTKAAFPLSWGIDNEVLESTVYHSLWPAPEQVQSSDNPRMNPSGVDFASVYGNAFAHGLLSEDLKQFPNLGPVLNGITARLPKISDSSSVYERWLDALGAEWADSVRFPGAPASSKLWDVKRLQTGLASWATLRETTILVNERAGAAEAGEGGFEELVYEEPRGYVEPAPKTFEAIAKLYESLGARVKLMAQLEPSLRNGIVAHLDSSAATTRRFGEMADRERRGDTLSAKDYAEIASVGGTAEHDFLLYKSLEHEDEAVAKPDPMPKIADVAGAPPALLEVAVGNPLQWLQIVPYFGRRQMVIGAVYSYHEFVSPTLYDNARWRKEVATHPHPSWVQAMIAPSSSACRESSAR